MAADGTVGSMAGHSMLVGAAGGPMGGPETAWYTNRGRSSGEAARKGRRSWFLTGAFFYPLPRCLPRSTLSFLAVCRQRSALGGVLCRWRRGGVLCRWRRGNWWAKHSRGPHLPACAQPQLLSPVFFRVRQLQRMTPGLGRTVLTWQSRVLLLLPPLPFPLPLPSCCRARRGGAHERSASRAGRLGLGKGETAKARRPSRSKAVAFLL